MTEAPRAHWKYLRSKRTAISFSFQSHLKEKRSGSRSIRAPLLTVYDSSFSLGGPKKSTLVEKASGNNTLQILVDRMLGSGTWVFEMAHLSLLTISIYCGR